VTDAETAKLRAKRDEVVAAIDKCLGVAASDRNQALVAIDAARKGLQALWGRIHEYHQQTAARKRAPQWGD
jgi:hypothetical protein